MSKYVNVTVSASLSTDFFVEVPDDVTEEQVREIAKNEVILPHTYPQVIDNTIKRMGIVVQGLDSMLKDWNVDKVEYILDGDFDKSSKGEQCNA